MIELLEFVFEGGGDVSVHVAEQEDDVVIQNWIRLLQPYLFDLEGVLVDLPQIFYAVRKELFTVFELAADEDQSSTIEIKTNEIGAFVGKYCVVVGFKFDLSMFHEGDVFLELFVSEYLQHIAINLLLLDQDVPFIVD